MENKTELNTNFNSARMITNCSSSFFKNDIIELVYKNFRIKLLCN